jgi:hypothetical protein
MQPSMKALWVVRPPYWFGWSCLGWSTTHEGDRNESEKWFFINIIFRAILFIKRFIHIILLLLREIVVLSFFKELITISN